MCGIAGLLRAGPGRGSGPDPVADGQELGAAVAAMTKTLEHRGPDGGDVWLDAEAGVALGHRRLAIQDLSPAGNQPMHSACGRWVVTYNGEIYDFPELRRELEGRGRRFRGHSDTEVLLEAVAEWGLETALERSVGMFAFALWDRRERTLWLARDRAGQKPLYYGWSGDVFLFGSELKALRAHPAFDAGIDRDALGLLLQYGWIPGPHTIFAGVRKLPAGSLLRVRAGGGRGEADAEPRAWWSARAVAERGAAQPFRGSLEEAVEALDARLREAVAGRMISDVSLGALLSGGIDSSTVVALMQAQSDRPVKTFSIGFHERSHDEAVHARAVAEHLGTEHTELYVTPRETLEVIPSLPSVYDEPFADASQIPTLVVSRLARGDVTVALSGDGGDELFAGYSRYARAERDWARWSRHPLALRRAAALGLDALGRAGWRALGPRGAADAPLPGWRRLPARLEKVARSLGATDPSDAFLRNALRCDPARRLVRGARPVRHAFSDPAFRAACAALGDPLQSMMTLDFVGYLADDILVKVDRASMAVSLEVRSPFLDHRVLELAWSLPRDLRVDAQGGKRVVRELLARYVPRALTDRRKQGFNVPVAAWLRGPLRGWAEDLLAPERLARQGLLHPGAVQRVWRQHLCGWRDQDNLLWSLLMFQAWADASGTA